MEKVNSIIEKIFDLEHVGISIVGNIKPDFDLKSII
jgi:hypothetical protein